MSSPFHHILVPTDFSDIAAHALRLAIRISRPSPSEAGTARITLLHVGRIPEAATLDFPAYGMPFPEAIADLQRELATERAHILERVARQEIPEGVPWDIQLREGYPSEEILAEVRTGPYDLVVMGTHGHTGIKRVLLGSVAERVLRHCERPVLVTR